MQAKLERVAYFQSSINFQRVASPVFDAPWHFHPEYELTYIVRGEGMRFAGDSAEAFRAGDFVLLGPEMPHYWVSQDSEAERGGLAEAYVCQFLGDFLGAAFWDKPEFARTRRLLERASLGLVVDEPLASRLSAQFCELRNLDPTRRLLALLELLATLADYPDSLRALASTAYKLKPRTAAVERLDRVLRLVHERYADTIALADAARIACMSRTAFCRFFRTQTGKTFSQFTNEVRIGRACHALVNTDALIIDVAQNCGFRNLSNFNRRFREITGVTPRQFRQRR